MTFSQDVSQSLLYSEGNTSNFECDVVTESEYGMRTRRPRWPPPGVFVGAPRCSHLPLT